MTPVQASDLIDAITKHLPEARIQELARELGIVRRERKLQVLPLVVALVFGFAVGTKRTLEGLRLCYQNLAGHTLQRASFHDRLASPGLATLMRKLAQEGLQALKGNEPTKRLFRAVLALDAHAQCRGDGFLLQSLDVCPCYLRDE